MAKIDEYLLQALEGNASDLHFISGDPVRARVHGLLGAQAGAPSSVCACMPSRASHLRRALGGEPVHAAVVRGELLRDRRSGALSEDPPVRVRHRPPEESG